MPRAASNFGTALHLSLIHILPFSIESALSLIPSAETLSPEVVRFDPAPTITSGVEFIDNAVNPSLSESFAAAPLASVNPLYVWTYLAGWVWPVSYTHLDVYKRQGLYAV